MQFNDKLYKAFLESIHDLEYFRMTYAAEHPAIPLEREDPDIKRLIEAMAFFATRTHLAGVRNIVDSRRRIFQQFFPYLLSPLPAMGMLQVEPMGQFVETTLLPKGSEIAISTETEETAFFRTLHDIRILPIVLSDVKMLLLPNKGFRFVLRLNASYSRNDEIGKLSFHINHLNDFHASLGALHALKKHLRKASVVFDKNATETMRGESCEVSVGALQDSEEDDWIHPLQKARLFFHFPQQELFFTIHVPQSPRNWSQCSIMLDLDQRWPRNLTLNKDVFQLFAVSITNLQRMMAQPLIHNGMRDGYALRHPEPEKRFHLHSVLGVYKIENHTMIPIRAGILSGGSGSYEIEQVADGKGAMRSQLTLHFPEIFPTPQTIAVDALWLQSWFSEAISQRLHVAPYSRTIVGLQWKLMGSIKEHTENAFQDEMECFLHLLTLQHKSALNRDDLISIIRMLGAHRGNFQRACKLLNDVRVEEAPLNKNERSGVLKLVYYLCFKSFGSEVAPLVETFIDHVGKILEAWISVAEVEVRMEVLETK